MIRRILLTLMALLVAGCARSAATEAPSPITSNTPDSTTTSLPASSTTTIGSVDSSPSHGPAEAPEEAVAVVTPTGVVAPVVRALETGWIVETPCANPVILTDGTAVHSAQVLIDPGHGGEETGATGYNGLRESDLNLDVAKRLQRYLEYRGVTTLLTRTADYRMAIAARASLAQSVEPAVFISIHHNGGPTTPWEEPGTLVFHQLESNDSRRLAGLIYDEIVTRLSELDISFSAGSPPGAVAMLNDAGGDYYGVLRRTDGITAVLSEAMFLSNRSEARALENGFVREVEAEALGSAILRFLDTNDPGTGFLDPRVFEGPGTGTGGVDGCEDPPLI